MGYIYIVTNRIDKKQYIGQTICMDVNSRWRQHKRKEPATVGKYLRSAYEKYGIENFDFKVLCICFDEDCNRFEKEYIVKYNTLAPNGYNLDTGGRKQYRKPTKKREPLSVEARQIIRQKNKEVYTSGRRNVSGANNPNFGKKMSEEQKKKISDRMKTVHQMNKQKFQKFETDDKM